MHDPRFNPQIRGMQMDAESKLRHQHGNHRRGSSVMALLIKLGVLIAIAVAFFWWVYS